MVMLLGLKKNEPKETLFVAAKVPPAQERSRTEIAARRMKPSDLAFKSPRLKSGLFIFLVPASAEIEAYAKKHPSVRRLASRFCSRSPARCGRWPQPAIDPGRIPGRVSAHMRAAGPPEA